MNDCNGKRIVLNTRLKCVNDVDFGKVYKVVSFCDACPVLGIYDCCVFLPLSEFNEENGNLVDFEVIKKNVMM